MPNDVLSSSETFFPLGNARRLSYYGVTLRYTTRARTLFLSIYLSIYLISFCDYYACEYSCRMSGIIKEFFSGRTLSF